MFVLQSHATCSSLKQSILDCRACSRQALLRLNSWAALLVCSQPYIGSSRLPDHAAALHHSCELTLKGQVKKENVHAGTSRKSGVVLCCLYWLQGTLIQQAHAVTVLFALLYQPCWRTHGQVGNLLMLVLKTRAQQRRVCRFNALCQVGLNQMEQCLGSMLQYVKWCPWCRGCNDASDTNVSHRGDQLFMITWALPQKPYLV